MSKGLLENSDLYQQKALLYHRFAQCEDAPRFIEKRLIPYIKDVVVADVGCGSGKYLSLLARYAKRYIGIDQASSVLALAAQAAKPHQQSECVLASAEAIPLPSNSVDVVLSSWVWGTIEDEKRRKKILAECSRILKSTGIILLVENDVGGEFEEVRGRYPFQERTYRYNRWLETVGKFKTLDAFETYFKFDSVAEARQMFLAIYGHQAASKIRRSIIEHRVKIFIAEKSYAATFDDEYSSTLLVTSST